MSFFANRSSRHAARLGPALTAHPARHIGFSRNRRRGEQTVRTGNPFKLAPVLCLALAIPFALAACGGGGGTPAKTAQNPTPGGSSPTPTPTPAPTPPAPPNTSYMGASPGAAPLAALQRIIDNENYGHIKSPEFKRYNRGPSLEDSVIHGGSGVLLGTELPKGSNGKELNRDNLAQHRIHELFNIQSRTGLVFRGLSPLQELPTIYHDDINQRFASAEILFKNGYGLNPIENNWPNISSAKTQRSCYQYHISNSGPCSANTINNPEDQLKVRFNDAGRPLSPPIEMVQYRDSEVAYLEYSAFFLNRSLQINSAIAYLPLDDPIPSYIRSGNYHAANFGGMAASAGQMTIGGASPPPIGTWKGGMLGVKYPLSPRNSGGVDHSAQPCRHPVSNGCTYSEATAVWDDLSRLTGDVTFTLMAGVPHSEDPGGRYTGDGQYPFSITFSNISDQGVADWTWTGGIEYDDVQGAKLIPIDLAGHATDEPPSFGANGNKGGFLGGFYGPNYEEIGGTFVRQPDNEFEITGAFGARKQ